MRRIFLKKLLCIVLVCKNWTPKYDPTILHEIIVLTNLNIHYLKMLLYKFYFSTPKVFEKNRINMKFMVGKNKATTPPPPFCGSILSRESQLNKFESTLPKDTFTQGKYVSMFLCAYLFLITTRINLNLHFLRILQQRFELFDPYRCAHPPSLTAKDHNFNKLENTISENCIIY